MRKLPCCFPKTGAGRDKDRGHDPGIYYKDSEDRLIATTAMPKLQVGETALLKVNDVSKIGAFLDMGLEKDVAASF